ncbi:MAG: hypothetical protein DME01_15675 [Candidatus Rokuibacteriota bacterium]|nr:MAG: hypothetical protein DME01_15675 [Candidatus Rokubacteria bacterium]
MPRQHRVESREITTRAFHFETTFHCGTRVARANDRRIWCSVNPAFRLGTGAQGLRAPVFNDFTGFASGTSSALAQCGSNNTAKEDEDMKRTSALAIFLGTALLAGAASAAVAPAEDIQAPRTSSQDIQAPRTSSQDIQAPRTGNEDIQAPRTSSQDIQAPRGPQAAHDRNEDIQAPRG